MAIAEDLSSIMRLARSPTRTSGRLGARAARPRLWAAPGPSRRSRPEAADAPVRLRLRVFVTRRWLDRQIVAGDVGDAPELLLRARQLTCCGSQRAAARSLRRAVSHVDAVGHGPDFSAVVVDRTAVRTSREALLGLADRLDRADDVSSRGMVLVTELLTNGVDSPLYGADDEQALAEAIWEISDALGPEQV
jgi:hypothetical protein